MEHRYESWRRRVDGELGSADFEEELVHRIPVGVAEGVRIEPLYTPDHPSTGDSASRGLPGQAPFTRGARPARGSGAPPSGASWSCCARYCTDTLGQLNQEILDDLAGGIDSLWLEAGGNGAAIATLDDLDRVLNGVLPQAITTVFDCGVESLAGAALLVAWLDEHGFDPAGLDLRFAADPLATLAATGRLPAAWVEIDGELAALAKYCSKSLPRARALVVSTLPYHLGGAHPAQELGYAMATLLHYLRVLSAHGLSLGDAARQIELRVAVDQDFFMEIAKLRALRTLWSKLFAACQEEPSPPPFVHAVASGRTLSRKAPWTNLLRGTGEMLAAVVAGADRITNAGYKDGSPNPSALSRRIARNTHTILAEESHLGEVADAAGGSYYVEELSDRLARGGWAHLQEIEGRGGMAACLESGFVQEEVARSWGGRLHAIACREQPITGISEFAQLDEEVEECQPSTTEASTTRPESGRVLPRAAREPVAELPKQGECDLPALIAAARAGASLSQLAASQPRTQNLRAAAIPPQRDAEPFERLRERAETLSKGGLQAKLWVACLGTTASHTARANFARRAFAAGGLATAEATVEPSAEAGTEVAQLSGQFARSCSPVAVICGPDESYRAQGHSLARALKEAGAQQLLLVAKPGAEEEAWRRAGVDRFLHLGCDLLRVLEGVLLSLEARGLATRELGESS